MRVVLFDVALGGHHLVYAARLTRHLHSEGDEVLFAMWRPDPRIDALEGADRPDRVVTVGRGAVPGPARSLTAGTRALRRCLRLAESWGADVLHLLYLDRMELPLILARRGGRPTRIVGTVLQTPYLPPSGGLRGGWVRRAFLRARRWGLRRLLRRGVLDVLLVPAEATRARLLGAFGEGIAARVAITPDPVDPHPPLSRDGAREALGLPDGVPIVLMFGGMRRDQGPEHLVEALAHLPGEWVAVLAGTTSPGRRRTLEAKLDRPLRSRVLWRLEGVSDEEMHRYFSAADVVAVPYRRSFAGTSSIVNRAAAAGRPVAATDVGEIGHLVRGHGLGLAVDPDPPAELARAIRTLLDDPGAWDPARARLYVAEIDWALTADRIRRAYRRGP